MDETWKCYGKTLYVVPPREMFVEHATWQGSLAYPNQLVRVVSKMLWLNPVRCPDGSWLMLNYSDDREVVYARPASQTETKRFNEQLLAGGEIR